MGSNLPIVQKWSTVPDETDQKESERGVKMKLKKPPHSNPQSSGFDYETCRWCKYFDKGVCTNDRAFNLMSGGVLDDQIQYAYEDSDVTIALEESNLSDRLLKKLEEYFTKKTFRESFEDMSDCIKDFLNEEVADVIVDTIKAGARRVSQKEVQGVSINDPCDFKCKYFW